MKVLLIFPPQGQPFLPHLALPSLKAFLNQEGYSEVFLKDVNLESYHYFLSPDFLKKAGNLPTRILDHIDEARQTILPGNSVFDPEKYYWAIRLLNDALQGAIQKYHPTKLDFKSFQMRYSVASSAEISSAIYDDKENPYIDFYQEIAIPEINRIDPDFIGISVCWHSQLIPAFTLARMIKEKKKSVHVTMGGSLISHLADLQQSNPQLLRLVDSFILYEGEIPLLQLLESLAGKREPDKVAGIMHQLNGRIIVTKPALVESAADLPVPDFDGFPVHSYFSPRPILPIAASRSCYWARCAFCDHYFSALSFRAREPETLLDNLIALKDQYGAAHFYFVDDAIPPRTLKALSRSIPENRLDIRFGGEIRFEPSLTAEDFRNLYQAGCRLLLFGMESYNQRILDLMMKGSVKEEIGRILGEAHQAGIITWLFFLLGFPSETKAEAEETLNFLIEHRAEIDLVSPSVFVLTRHSKVIERPADYGVDLIEPHPRFDLVTSYKYESHSGLAQFEARKLLDQFLQKKEVRKFLKPFVTEPHTLLFEKVLFSQGPDVCESE